jgi:quercetin dioxygenase-like cupin family protein
MNAIPPNHEGREVVPPAPRLKVLSDELPPGRPVLLGRELDYVRGSIVSRPLARAPGGSITLVAFDTGQELSEHTASFDAYVQVLAGAVELTIGPEVVVASAGETVRVPAGTPHAVRALEPLKVLLSMVKG